MDLSEIEKDVTIQIIKTENTLNNNIYYTRHKHIIDGFIKSLRRSIKIRRLFCIEDEDQ